MDAIAACFCAHVHDRVADSGSLAFLHIFLIDQTDAHCVDQRIAFVARVEDRFAADSRNTDTVAVTADTGNDFFEDVFRTLIVQFAETQRVKDRNRACAHAEDVTDNSADTGSCTFIRLDS